MCPSPHAQVLEIKAALAPLGTAARRRSNERFVKGGMPSLGVSVADLRKQARRHGKRLAEGPKEEALTLLFALVGEGTLELRLFAYLLLERLPGLLESLSPDQRFVLGDGMDSWGVADTYGLLVLGESWRRGLVDDAFVHALAASPDRWWRRAALVATVALNRKAQGGRGDAPRTLRVCAMLAEDRDDMVVKGLSWALRALVPWEPEAVQAFLAERDLAARVRREVGNKLRTGRKSG